MHGPRACTRPGICFRSVREARIELERRLAEDPVLVARLGERERLLCRSQNFLHRPYRVREIRSPGDALCAESIDDLAEERLRIAFAPALRRHVDWRDLQIDLLVLRQREEFVSAGIRRPFLERRA